MSAEARSSTARSPPRRASRNEPARSGKHQRAAGAPSHAKAQASGDGRPRVKHKRRANGGTGPSPLIGTIALGAKAIPVRETQTRATHSGVSRVPFCRTHGRLDADRFAVARARHEELRRSGADHRYIPILRSASSAPELRRCISSRPAERVLVRQCRNPGVPNRADVVLSPTFGPGRKRPSMETVPWRAEAARWIPGAWTGARSG